MMNLSLKDLIRFGATKHIMVKWKGTMKCSSNVARPIQLGKYQLILDKTSCPFDHDRKLSMHVFRDFTKVFNRLIFNFIVSVRGNLFD